VNPVRTLRWVVTGVRTVRPLDNGGNAAVVARIEATDERRALEIRFDAVLGMSGADLALAGGIVGMADKA